MNEEALRFFLFLFFVELSLVLGSSFLILLIFGNQIVHVGFSLGELHLVHTLALGQDLDKDRSCRLTSVPVKESFSSEHGGKLFRDSLEELLNGCRVADEGGGHLEASWGNVTDSSFDVVGNPLDEVGRVLVLNVEHLLVDFLHRHASSEHGCDGKIPKLLLENIFQGSKVPSVTRITGGHHVLGVEHLLSELRNSQSSVLLGASGCERGESGHEEVKSREGNLKRRLSKSCRGFPVTILTASFRRSAFNCPGNRRHVVTPDMVTETR
jgi:hypothetical protein